MQRAEECQDLRKQLDIQTSKTNHLKKLSFTNQQLLAENARLRDELAMAKKLKVSPDIAKDELIRLRDSQIAEFNSKLDEWKDGMKVADDRIATMKKHEKELMDKMGTL